MQDAPTDSPKSNPVITWGPAAAIIVTIAVYLLGQIIGGLLVLLYPTVRGLTADQSLDWIEQSIAGQFWMVLMIEVITLFLLHEFLRWRKSGFKALGLIGRPKLKEIGYALVGYCVYFGSYIVILIAAQTLIPSLDAEQPQQIGFEDAKQGIELLLVFLSLVILPPVTEEIITRGFLYSGLKTRLPKYMAVLITSGIFAAAHLQFGSGAPLLWVAALDTFTLSLVLIYLRDKTGRLWAPIFLHGLKNAVAFFVLFIYPLLKVQ